MVLPRDYYMLLPHELSSMAEGYRAKQYKLSCERRHAAFLSILPFTKDVSLDKFNRDFWPLAGDRREEPEEGRPVIEAELWNKILARHKIKQHG